MKEKVPDKIYCWNGVMGSIYASSQKPSVKTEEYIRKDALLEYLNKCKDNPVITELQRGNIQELIDKIKSL